jgi:hypothetical protein
MMMMMVNAYENVRGMSLAAAHVVCIVTVSACSALLGMAHGLDGSEIQSIYIGCLASFSAHGVTATIKGNTGNGENRNG